MTLGRLLVVTLCAADANVGQQASAAAHAVAVAKAQAAHAKLNTVQRQLSGVQAKMQSDLNAFLELSRQQDEKDAREDFEPSSFIETGKPVALTQMTAKEVAANKAKSAAAHAHLAAIQGQLASVNAKMQTDMENVLQISRQQDEEDMHDQDAAAAAPSSLIENGHKKKGRFGEQVPPGLEQAADKLHAVEDQLRRMDHQFQANAGQSALPNIADQLSLVQEKETDQDPSDSHTRGAEWRHHVEAMLKHRKQEREEFDQEHQNGNDPDADMADNEDSLLQTGAKDSDSDAMMAKLADSIKSSKKSLAFTKAFLEEADIHHRGTPKIDKSLKEARKQEKTWETKMEADSQARLKKFDEKFNHANTDDE